MIYNAYNQETGMGILDTTMNIITLGGHSRLIDAEKRYNKIYERYKKTHEKTVSLHCEIQQEVECLGKLTICSLELIDEVSQLFKDSYYRNTNSIFNKPAPVDFNSHAPKSAAILENYSANKSVAEGIAISSTFTAGSWVLVSLLGSASTGASIAGLSGVAATNATLAWFGGGALTAGGAGMAGGAMVLGGFIAVPLVVYSAWSSHSKAEDVEQKIASIKMEEKNLKEKTSELEAVMDIIANEKKRFELSLMTFKRKHSVLKKQLNPYGLINVIWREFRHSFGRPYYTPKDHMTLLSLSTLLEEFSEIFTPTSTR